MTSVIEFEGAEASRYISQNILCGDSVKKSVQNVTAKNQFLLHITKVSFFIECTELQRICYSHWANGAQNGVISIGQWGVFNHEKGAI